MRNRKMGFLCGCFSLKHPGGISNLVAISNDYYGEKTLTEEGKPSKKDEIHRFTVRGAMLGLVGYLLIALIIASPFLL